MPFHPGAAKFYKEAGIDGDDALIDEGAARAARPRPHVCVREVERASSMAMKVDLSATAASFASP